jgi:hypothetical protein
VSAINYARHRSTGQLVFLEPGQAPDHALLEADWAWWLPPKPHPRAQYAMRIGESPASHEARLRSERS